MEKLRIAQLGLMQAVALAYGILACGATVRLSKEIVENGYSMPWVYSGAVFLRHYGVFFFLVIIGWAFFASYYSSSFGKQRFDERLLAGSGIFLIVLFFLMGSILAFGTGVAATMPHGGLHPL